uniref:Uncharacterized protein n=1 Tax=Arion vulgaris TaxID=1028688 RepID=A0A0B7ABL7_9EUPU
MACRKHQNYSELVDSLALPVDLLSGTNTSVLKIPFFFKIFAKKQDLIIDMLLYPPAATVVPK